MTHNNTAFQQLLKPISRHEFEGLAKKHHVGQKLRSASRWDQFAAMSMCQFSARQSLRDIESNLKAQKTKLYHIGAKPIARSTLARINEQQSPELYQELFFKLLSRAENLPGKHKFRFKNPLYSMDGSLIDLSTNQFKWASCYQDTAGVKLSVGLNHRTLIPEFVSLSDGNVPDIVEGRKFEFPKGSIVAFDKGYIDYKWYKNLTNAGVYFVTRIKSDAAYEVLESYDANSEKGIIMDQKIQMNGGHGMRRGAPILRKVAYFDYELNKYYEFLTNNFNLSAKTIANIYKDRWQVELFFKALKQNLKIQAFTGLSKNAVLSQIWIALICYLLLSIAKHSAKEGWSVQRILRIIQLNLFERKGLKELFDPDVPKGRDQHLQWSMEI